MKETAVIRILRSFRIFAFALLLMPFVVSAENESGILTGHVADASGAVLEGATVQMVETSRAVATNANGDFTFVGVAQGTYHVQVVFVGFEEALQKVKVTPGTNKPLQFLLKVSSENEQVVVVAPRVHGEAEAINRIKTGENILQIATSEVISSLPNGNIAEAVGRMPSVSLDRDEGEGAYLQVRGTEPRLTNVTVNGNTIPSEEGGVRQMRLDAVAADLLGSVEVNKTLSANQDADGIGGSVNFVTKTAEDKPTLIMTGLGGFSRIAPGRNVGQLGVTAGKRFGADKKLGILGGFSWDFNGRGFDNIQPSFASGSTTYKDLQTREYMYNRSRWGLTGGIDYKLNNGSSLYMKGLFSEIYDFGTKWYYDYIQDAAPKFYTSKKSPIYAVSNLSVGGKHFFGMNVLQWDLASSYSWEDAAAGNPRADFSWIPTSTGQSIVHYTIDQATDGMRPTFTPAYAKSSTSSTTQNAIALSDLQNPANYVLLDAYTSAGRSGALSLSGSTDYQRIHKFSSRYATFSAGFKMRNVHRGQNALQTIYDLGGTGAKATGALSSAYRMTNFLSDFTNSNFYDGYYKLGPVTDFDTIIKNAVGTLLIKDTAATLSKSQLANYNLVERISAGYLMESLDLTSRLHLQVGLRFENTYESGWGFKLISGATSATRTDTQTQSYLDPLPSAQLRYSPTQNDNIRVVYSRGIARPNPLQLIPYVNETDGSTTCPTGYTCAGTLSIGNPNLKAEYANNYDILYERFMKHLGMIQAGFFYKDLSNPLLTTVGISTYNGAYYATTQPVNGTTAKVYGFEIGYQQRLSYLPGMLGGLGINANYSYTDGEANGIPYTSGGATTYRTAPLLRQAPHTWNISPTYDRGRVSLRGGINFNSHNLYSYANVDPSCTAITCNANGPAGDNYVYNHTQIDAQGSARLYKGLTFIAYGQNLNNAPFGYYNGDPKYMVQREYYKQTIAFGLKYDIGQKER
jgi:TonB-dependent receptor